VITQAAKKAKKKAGKATSIVTGADATKLTSAGLTAAATGAGAAALVKSPAAQEIKSTLGYGPNTSLIRAPIGQEAREDAAPPGKNYGQEGSFMNKTSGALLGGAAAGSVLGASIGVPMGGQRPKPTFQISGRPSSPAAAAKKFGKGAANVGVSTFGNPGFLRTLGGVAGGTAGAALVGRSVDRLARKVVRTGTPADRQLPDPTQPKRSRTRTGTTSPSVANQARSQGAPTGSMVLDLHKTGGSGGVMT
jgi:hypothetical protein